MKLNPETPYFNNIITTLCSAVGINTTKFNPKKEGWYNEHTWTLKEQDKFKEWMIAYLLKNDGARKEILQSNINTKFYVKAATNNFILAYGWRIK